VYTYHMKTRHILVNGDARRMSSVADNSVNIVVTSPPYPMIAMWDALFASQSSLVRQALLLQDGPAAFEAMNKVLDQVWDECFRVLFDGSFLCINIGDATRTLGDSFRLYANAARITAYCEKRGFASLPPIIWRKQTNAPNKFMGSGMLPGGAYVTLEHEYILLFRKGEKRIFDPASAQTRRESAFFWEERNLWFSDLWDFKGARQTLGLKNSRERSAAFPFDLPFRLINMFSLTGETVLDPFVGTGTTMAAAMACARNSIGYDCDGTLLEDVNPANQEIINKLNDVNQKRLLDHLSFMNDRHLVKGEPDYHNCHGSYPVVTRQETELRLWNIVAINPVLNGFDVEHEELKAVQATEDKRD